MRILLLLATAAALAGAPACFHPEFHDVACGADGACPDGTSCFEGTCSATTTPGCPAGQITSLGGTVHAPNGTLPLYDVLVYVPDGDPPELPEGASCTRCGAPPPSLALARTGSDGTFTLRHVPAGDAIPIVIETGKWRRQIVVPVAACTEAVLDAELTRLPRTRAEGALPRIAVTTGFTVESFECLLRKVGVDDSEFGTDGGPERIHLYRGATNAQTTNRLASGASFAGAETMWADPARLGAYDQVLLSCPGTSQPAPKPPGSTTAMYDYAAAGGRILAEHRHSEWLSAGPPDFQAVATFYDTTTSIPSLDASVDVSTPRGAALSDWLMAIGASTVAGKIQIKPAAQTVVGLGPEAERIVLSSAAAGAQVFAVTTPPAAPAEQRCGRLVYTDSHITQGGSGAPFPLECTSADLRPQEKLLAYQLFDLGRCVGGP